MSGFLGGDVLSPYFKQLSRYPLLDKAEEVRLARLIEAGQVARAKLADQSVTQPADERRRLRRVIAEGDAARRWFVCCNLRLVVSVAKRYHAANLALADLVQDGNIGLMAAVERFDHRRGFRFSTFATWHIRHTINEGIAATGHGARLPVHARDELANIRSASAEFEAANGRRPTRAETAMAVGLTVERIDLLGSWSAGPASLSERTPGAAVEIGDTFVDRSAPSPLEMVLAYAEADGVHRLLDLLPPRSRHLLRLRYGIDSGQPRSLEEMSHELRLSRERIRQIERAALEVLRVALTRGEREAHASA